MSAAAKKDASAHQDSSDVVDGVPEPEAALLQEAPAAALPEDDAPAARSSPAAPDATVSTVPRPRIRWGAIAWALIVGSIATVTLSITRTAASREEFALWVTGLGPAGIWLIVVLVAGGILFLLGLLAAIRRAQRAR